MSEAESKTSSFDEIEATSNCIAYAVDANVTSTFLSPDESAMVISFFANQIRIIFEATFSQAFDSRVSVLVLSLYFKDVFLT
jgi:hypothetical protein